MNVEDSIYAKARPAFDALIIATRFTPPNTGADLLAKNTEPLDPARVQVRPRPARGMAAGAGAERGGASVRQRPAERHLVRQCARAGAAASQHAISKSWPSCFPTSSSRRIRNCEIISCKVIAQGKEKALETVVRTDRGPFSMTVIERRFRGDRFDYEVKYTVETKRFDQLVPKLRESLDSFREMPGDVPGAATEGGVNC